MRLALPTALLVAAPVAAQTARPTPAPAHATRAAAVGVGWSSGIIGAEYVVRSVPWAPRVGAAATAGFFGPGGRLTVAPLSPWRRVVPYAGVGVTSDLWGLRAGVGTGGLRNTHVLAVLDAGVQLWPAGPRGLYVDLGAGGPPGAPRDVRLLPRVLVGGAF